MSSSLACGLTTTVRSWPPESRNKPRPRCPRMRRVMKSKAPRATIDIDAENNYTTGNKKRFDVAGHSAMLVREGFAFLRVGG